MYEVFVFVTFRDGVYLLFRKLHEIFDVVLLAVCRLAYFIARGDQRSQDRFVAHDLRVIESVRRARHGLGYQPDVLFSA